MESNRNIEGGEVSMEMLTEYNIDSFGVKRACLKEPTKRSICTGCEEDCTTCSFRMAIEKLAAYERMDKDGELPCPMCDNARVNGDLTDRNDLHYCAVGDSEDGFRVMIRSGAGRPMALLFEQRRKLRADSQEQVWMTMAVYEPKFCPNCGRELSEYGDWNEKG